MLIKTNKSLVCHKHKIEFKMESYLTQLINTSHRRKLTKLQLSDHKLEIESGRHIRPKINSENKSCKLCSEPDKQAPVEDEVHFITRNVIISCK